MIKPARQARMLATAIIVALGTLLPAAPALAHRLKLFALVEDGAIHGSVYFVGGAPATGAFVRIADSGGRPLAELKPDAAGAFRYTPMQRIDHVMVADTGDGHVARWTIRAAELPPSLEPAAAAVAPPVVESPTTDARPRPPSAEPLAACMATDQRLAELVEQALARQLRPLREQLLAYEEQVRWRDLLGALGYLLGLSGLALWWTRRPRP